MNRFLPLLITIFLLITAHCVFSQGIWKTYTTADGLAGNKVICIAQDKQGNMWFGTWGAGLSKLDTDGNWTNFLSSVIYDIEIDSLNNKWLTLLLHEGGQYIGKFNDTVLVALYDVQQGDAKPACLGQDSLGQIWCGMTDYGLACWFDGIEWHLYGVIGTGIYSNIEEIKTDRLGKLYFAHSRGISTLTEFPFYGTPVYDFAFDKQNRMWLATNSDWWGLAMFDGKDFHAYTTAQGLLSNYLVAVAVDSSNNVWFSYSGSLGVSKFDGTKFTHFNHNDGLADNLVYDIFVDKDGDIWFAAYRGGVSVLHDTMTTRVQSISEFANDKKITRFYNYPNPFNKATIIRYTLNVRSKIELKVFNLLGEEVIALLNSAQQAGEYEIVWNGTNHEGKEVKSGIYIAVLKFKDFKKSIKLSLIR